MYQVGILDSGVGALSMSRALTKIPRVRQWVVMDQAHFPYGERSEAELIALVGGMAERLLEHTRLHALIIACNTASTVVLPHLRRTHGFPVIGVVPAIKPAARLSRTKAIAILATEGTNQRSYTDQLIEDFASDCTVMRVSCPHLVEQAERRVQGKAVDMQALRKDLKPLLESSLAVDQVVLGCTHFPLLSQELAALLPAGVGLVDSSPAIARRLQTLIDSGEMKDDAGQKHAAGSPYPSGADHPVEAVDPLERAHPVEGAKSKSAMQDSDETHHRLLVRVAAGQQQFESESRPTRVPQLAEELGFESELAVL